MRNSYLYWWDKACAHSLSASTANCHGSPRKAYCSGSLMSFRMHVVHSRGHESEVRMLLLRRHLGCWSIMNMLLCIQELSEIVCGGVFRCNR